ncbi:MAG: hypothetical protein WCO06_06075 [Candidatus Roizmanbacteria bacterium]
MTNKDTPPEQKIAIGKNLKTYEQISAVLKDIYNLSTISEIKQKSTQNYTNIIDKHIKDLLLKLQSLNLLPKSQQDADVHSEVLNDFSRLKDTMSEELKSGIVEFQTGSTVAFRDLVRAPDMDQTCQRLTDITEYNQAAYSRLIDGNDEMVDVTTMINGKRLRVGRSFIELSRIKLNKEEKSRIVVLVDKAYIDPQYQRYERFLTEEIWCHMLDRMAVCSSGALLMDLSKHSLSDRFLLELNNRGYRYIYVSGSYLVNQSTVPHQKYYDSFVNFNIPFSGLKDVKESNSVPFKEFVLIERIPTTDIVKK